MILLFHKTSRLQCMCGRTALDLGFVSAVNLKHAAVPECRSNPSGEIAQGLFDY